MIQWLIDFQNALVVLSGGMRPLYKLGDTYYASSTEKSQPLHWLINFKDGLLMPGHIRQSVYNIDEFLKNTTRTLPPEIDPVFFQYYYYGFRPIYKGKKFGLISVITTNNRFIIKLSRMLYSGINDFYQNIVLNK